MVFVIEKLVIGFGQIGKLASAGPVVVLPVAALVAPLTMNSVTDEEPVVPPTPPVIAVVPPLVAIKPPPPPPPGRSDSAPVIN